jgi:opacity protein-like surface antigen
MVLTLFVSLVLTGRAAAQGFVAPTSGYNFGGDAGCRSATDCEEKNWNLGVGLGFLGSIVGFETEFTYEDAFGGDRGGESSEVLTLMGNFMLAPKIKFVQPYGLAGIGLIKTSVDNDLLDTDESENQIGWTVGGGVLVFVHRHIGLKFDVRHYHAFEALELLGIDLERENKIDFGRAAFGVHFTF